MTARSVPRWIPLLIVTLLMLQGHTSAREAAPGASASPVAGPSASPGAATADGVYREAVRKVRARDLLGLDASKNGYSDLKAVLQRETPEQAKAPYKAMAEWSYSATGSKDKDVLVAYGANTVGVQASAKQFETVLPILDRVLAKPNFIWPSEWDRGPSARVPNFIQLRSIVQNLVGYAEYCAVTGRPSRALSYLVGCIELGGRVSQNSVLLVCMIGVALDSIGVETAFQVLGRSPALTADDCRNALTRLAAVRMTPQTFLDRMDEDHAFQVATLDMVLRDPACRKELDVEPDLADVKRAQSIVPEIYLKLRPSLERFHDPLDDGVDVDRLVQESRSRMVAALVPNSRRAMAHFRFTLTKMGALKLLLALQLHKLEKGSYPDSLDALVPGALPTLPEDYMSADGRFVYTRTGADFQLSTTPRPSLARLLDLQTYSYHPPPPRK